MAEYDSELVGDPIVFKATSDVLVCYEVSNERFDDLGNHLSTSSQKINMYRYSIRFWDDRLLMSVRKYFFENF